MQTSSRYLIVTDHRVIFTREDILDALELAKGAGPGAYVFDIQTEQEIAPVPQRRVMAS